MTKKRVFIIEQFRQNFDMTSVHKFGTPITLIDSSVRRPSIFHVEDYQDAVVELFEANNFNTKHDSVCVVGALINMTLAIAALTERYGRINVLLYNSSLGEYVKRTVGGKHEQASKTTV